MSKKIKSLKEISNDWKKWNKKNWDNFTKGFNDFFGIPNKNLTATDHITKDTAIDITPEDIKNEFKRMESNNNSALIEFENKPLTPAAWEKFENSTMSSFNDMRQKINKLHQRNLNNIEEKIKIGKANYKIWLMRNEIKNTDLKEQQKLAIQRFQEWSKSNQENVSEYFEEQKREWQNQFVVWKKSAKAMPGKMKDNRVKMRKDYEEWIYNRRKRTLKKMKYKIEKSNFRMRLQWRRSLNSLVFFMPIIIIAVVVIILISVINRS